MLPLLPGCVPYAPLSLLPCPPSVRRRDSSDLKRAVGELEDYNRSLADNLQQTEETYQQKLARASADLQAAQVGAGAACRTEPGQGVEGQEAVYTTTMTSHAERERAMHPEGRQSGRAATLWPCGRARVGVLGLIGRMATVATH